MPDLDKGTTLLGNHLDAFIGIIVVLGVFLFFGIDITSLMLMAFLTAGIVVLVFVFLDQTKYANNSKRK